MREPTRRRFLRGSLGASAGLFLGCSDGEISTPAPVPSPPQGCDAFEGGELLGTVPFVGEEDPELETPLGAGLDGRLYTDLERLDPGGLVLPVERFYIRTRYPDLLDPRAPWSIAVGGLVDAPLTLGLADLEPLVAPAGVHLMECSGNGAFAHFGMLSATDWDGVPLAKVLELAGPTRKATRVLVSGFDQHSQPSAKSTPGASWVLSLDQVAVSGAFIATRMNGAALTRDHGAPVRLVVPGWYGCTCIKWVNEIRLVDEDEPATSQMQEFASRTMQSGVPDLARDYLPASIDQAAMPVRIERWRLGGRLAHRVVGVIWGGSAPTNRLEIRLGAGEPWRPVAVCPPQTTNATWTLWSYRWEPAAAGTFAIRMRVDDPGVVTRRLDSGFYERVVTIGQV